VTWSDSWSTQQLVEFVAAVSACVHPSAAALTGVERAAEAFDADVAALLRNGDVVATIGFRAGQTPQAELRAAFSGAPLSVPGLGVCPVVTATVSGVPPGRLLIARDGAGFSVEEASLLRGMGRVLSLTFRQQELIEELTDRQRLLEQLGVVQRALARRAPLQEVLDAITGGACDLLCADVVVLRLLDADDRRHTLMVSDRGFSTLQAHRARRLPLSVGLAGAAMTAGSLVSVSNYEQLEVPVAGFIGELTAAMAIPVRENGQIVGALMVASTAGDRQYSPREREVLTVFADQVSLALTDAHTVQAVHQARHDQLTGLPNRGLFFDRVDHELVTARDLQPTSVLFVDLDRFKAVNDTMGHQAGDELLVAVAARIRGAVRDQDLAGRLGGDEFAVLLPGADTAQAVQIAGRVLDAVGSPLALAGRHVSVGASVGVATSDSRDDQSCDGAVPVGSARDAAELLRNADLAMYRAKSGDGHRYEVFAPALAEAARTRAELQEDLNQALDAGQLWVALQPIIELSSGSPVGAEALLRWDHPVRGPVLPLEFVPLAEENGLIVGIGRWVLREACALAAGWPDPNPDGAPLSVAVNLSARQLADPDLVADVTAGLTDSGLDPGRLTVEVTESLLVADIEANLQQLDALKALGVRLAVDDFGTGYSSLAYLAQFPFDILKIDRSFVAGMAGNPRTAALTESIVRLGQSLHLEIVAEGVEDAGQLRRLRALGCPYGQGYALGRPTHPGLFPPPKLPRPRSGALPKSDWTVSPVPRTRFSGWLQGPPG